MKSLFRLQGNMERVPYFLISIALFVAQCTVEGIVFAIHHDSAAAFWTPWMLLPFSLTRLSVWLKPRWVHERWLFIPVLLAHLTLAWLLLAIAIRRARSVGASWLAASLVIVPIVQIAVILWLGASSNEAPAERVPASRVSPGVVIQGLVAGVVLTLLLVVASTLVFRAYGSLLFLASPFVVGVVTAYIGNRRADMGRGPTTRLVMGACFLGGVALLAIAIEGLICLAMASPLIAAGAWLGGLAGRAVALKRPGAARSGTAMSFAVLPAFLVFDLIVPPHVAFETTESIEVAATDQAVWDAIVHMGPIPEPPAAPFRWGLAYPMSGTISSEGVGAIREGVFSTGVAYERVTEWEPARRLSFIVLSDPPTMGELSPYRDVNAPHVEGYFRTLDARFTITPLPDGRTRLSLATRHELDLRPAFYWLPLTKWAIHTNKVRVLTHFARQAEAG